MTCKILLALVDRLIKQKMTRVFFVCSRRARTTTSWSSVCGASFIKFSNEIAHHSLVSFVVGNFCIIGESVKIFTMQTFYKYLYSAVNVVPYSLINDKIYDITDFFNFHAWYVKVENYFHAIWPSIKYTLLPYFHFISIPNIVRDTALHCRPRSFGTPCILYTVLAKSA